MALSKDEKQRIKEAIAAAEAQTGGELVAVVARSADDYWDFTLAGAAVVALAVPAIALLFWPALNAFSVYEFQLEAFLGTLVLLRWPSLRQRVVPVGTQLAYARRLARAQFFIQGLHRTQARAGVLLFVSLAEHYVEIIADEGVNRHVEAQTWETIVAQFVQAVRARRTADGFIAAIEACGAQLRTHFPRTQQDRNELTNRLIELP